MNIVQLISNVSNVASGPSYSVVRLSQALAAHGHDVRLLSVEGEPIHAEAGLIHETFPRDKLLSQFWFSKGLKAAIDGLPHDTQILHSHGLWRMPNVYPKRVAGRICQVISPRGTLSAWALSHRGGRKRLFWNLVQRPAIECAQLLHATAEAEVEDIRRAGFRQPVAMIPNGIDLPQFSERKVADRKRALFLARLHPGKGLDLLLRAWALVMDAFPDWELEIVGPDEDGYGQEMKALAAQLSIPNVIFSGALFGAEKDEAYAGADLYVLPSASENFGLTVAEALAAGVPAIVAKGAPWQGLEMQGAGWWIDRTVDELAATLRVAMSLAPDERQAMGRRGRAWMERDFGWPGIADKMALCYAWLAGVGAKPDFIFLD